MHTPLLQKRFLDIKEIVERKGKRLSKPLPEILNQSKPLNGLIIKSEKPTEENKTEDDSSTLDEDFNTELISPMMRRCVSDERGMSFRSAVSGDCLTPTERQRLRREVEEYQENQWRESHPKEFWLVLRN